MNTDYPHLIKRILRQYAKYYQQAGIPLHRLFDDETQSYILLKIAWQDKKYIHRATLHLELIDGKIRVQHDDTEDGVATDLLDAGVPGEDIVLGFKHPSLRPYTEFAAV